MKILIVFVLSLILVAPAFCDTETYLNTAILFKESGELEKAAEILSKAIDDSDQDLEASSYLARLNYSLSKPKEVIDILNGLKKKAWYDFIYLGLAYEDLGKTNKAISSYLESLRIRKNSIALLRLAKIYRKLGNYKPAVKYFKQLIDLDSSIRIGYYYLGDCYFKLKQYKRAYKFLAKAVNFYPESKEVKELFGKVKKQLGEDFFIAKKKAKEKQRQGIKLPSYLAEEEISYISIGLAKGLKRFSFSCQGEFVISDGVKFFRGKPNTFYTILIKDKKLVLKGYEDLEEYDIFLESINIVSSGKGRQKYPFYLLDITYSQKDFWHKIIDRAYRGDIEVVAKAEGLSLINRLSIEEYLYGVLAAEIPPSVHSQALRAQAVAARTLTFRRLQRHLKEGFDLCADVHCQVYQGMSAETSSTIKAVDSTRGEILTLKDKPIETFYHSNCGGCLASDVFGQEEYLAHKIDAEEGSLPESNYEQEKWFVEKPDTFCSKVLGSNYRWQRVYDREDFLIAFGFKIEEFLEFRPKKRGECFHYQELDVITKTAKEKLKSDLAIRNYFDRLRSSAFKFELKKSSQGKTEMLIFWGAGFGHGTGFCQEGAIAMAKEGSSYQEILKHYYPKAKLEKQY